ncbi:MAG: type II toxin-antitoxin system RelE/ParE family toxin [Betaproteobacteria bacterium]|nr:type II toxin-antitoxin system RelE/ParE family toxin [Betaproteobacteria bacterium]
MSAQIRWHEAAVRDLIALRAYIAQDNPPAAARIAQAIRERVALLQAHPMLGRAGRLHGTRELVVSGTPYTVVYLPEADRLTVLRVFHQARQW